MIRLLLHFHVYTSKALRYDHCWNHIKGFKEKLDNFLYLQSGDNMVIVHAVFSAVYLQFIVFQQ